MDVIVLSIVAFDSHFPDTAFAVFEFAAGEAEQDGLVSHQDDALFGTGHEPLPKVLHSLIKDGGGFSLNGVPLLVIARSPFLVILVVAASVKPQNPKTPKPQNPS